MSRQSVVFLAAVPETLRHFVAPVARALHLHGISTVAIVGQSDHAHQLDSSFDQVHQVTSFRRASVSSLQRASAEIRDAVESLRPSLLHLHTPYGVALGRIASVRTGVPHIAVIHGTLFGVHSREMVLFALGETVAGRMTPTYITLNHEDRRSYRRMAPRANVLLAPCGGAGIDVRKLRSQASLASKRRDDGHPVALVLGRLTPDKGLDLAVAAWSQATQVIPNLRLRFVGSPANGEEPWLPPAVEGVEHRPWTDTPGAELAQADLLLTCSPREGFPLAVAEALALEVPVVAVSNRGSRMIHESVASGLHLAPGSAPALASTIESVYSDGLAHVSPAILDSWSQERVVEYHVNEILARL